MPQRVQPRQAEGRAAHPEEPAVYYHVHRGRLVPRVADAQHVVQQDGQEERGAPARVRIRDVVGRRPEPGAVPEQVHVFAGVADEALARGAEAGEEVEGEQRGERDREEVGGGHHHRDHERVRPAAEEPEHKVPRPSLLEGLKGVRVVLVQGPARREARGGGGEEHGHARQEEEGHAEPQVDDGERGEVVGERAVGHAGMGREELHVDGREVQDRQARHRHLRQAEREGGPAGQLDHGLLGIRGLYITA